MQEGQDNNASEARFMKKKYKQGGQDEEEEYQDRQFKEDFEKALKNHSKKSAIKDVQKQIEYFGYKMQPFNMREEQQMGQIDQEGFFVFNNRKRLRDAWMDSLNQNDGQEAIDTLRKKIKQEHRQKNVYQADKRIEENDKQDDQEQNQQQEEQEQKPVQQQDKFQPKEIKLLLSELLPFNTSANQYMKKLKKQKKTELYDKILLLCNQYIAATGEHDILTLKKEDLEEQQEQEEEKPIQNWDAGSSEQQHAQKKQNKKNQQKQQADEDDIF